LDMIKGFLETSFVDWPGRMASVLFLPRCNYRCPYCHNHKLVTDPDSLGSWPLEMVLDRLETLRGWVDGICVTGGEPTFNDNLIPLLQKLKDKGWPVKLDTNGSRPEVLKQVIEQGLACEFSVDIKAPLEPIPYRRNGGPGADPEPVRESLGIISRSGLPVELRTTIHPDLLSLEEVKRLASQTCEILGEGRVLKLQRCRVDDTLDPAMAQTTPLEQDVFEEWAAKVRSAGVVASP
jgi:pyruvate formate lyase activating enzyme